MADHEPAPPIEGFVPLALPPSDPTPARRTGWPKGKPRGTKKKPGAIAETFDVSQLRKGSPGHCEVCGKEVAALSIELIRELVRSSRDRIQESGNGGPQVAITDTLYLAARFDGYCSLTCWRRAVAGD